MEKLKKIQTKFSVRDGGHYTPAVEFNGLIFISGQLSINPEDGSLPEGVKNHAKQALKNLDEVLKAADLKKEDIIQCRIYIPNVEYWPELNEAYAEYFGEHKPARVVVPARDLYGGSLVEIEAVAAR